MMASLIKRPGSDQFYLQWLVGGKIRRKSLRTTSLQIAKEKQRQFESGRLQGIDNPLPTRTSIPDVMDAYIGHIRAQKASKNVQTLIYYLRTSFGVVGNELTNTSRRCLAPTQTKRRQPTSNRSSGVRPIEANCFEEITTKAIQDFIDQRVRVDGIAPKTANHYRSIIRRVFNWAMEINWVRMSGDRNPASSVKPYRVADGAIRFLTLAQIDEQLETLAGHEAIQRIVATAIYAGLRRSELLWLTVEDVHLPAGKTGYIQINPKEYRDENWHSKTGTKRVIPISTDLRAHLEGYLPPPSDGPCGGWFFPSPQGKLWDPDNFASDLRALNQGAKLRWTCLDYRHTFGSHLAMQGVSLYKISKMMGNSPEICRRHYAALLPESLEAEVEFRKNGRSMPVMERT